MTHNCGGLSLPHKAEILAPAGGEEALKAAVRCGADAVYLGLTRYGARARAHNFTIKALSEAARYCRSRGVLVYVTLNTLLLDCELADFLRTVRDLCALPVDAVIVQDMGAAKLIQEIAPDLPLHASTQMSIQTLGGIQLLADFGFKRVVLPRELSRNELSITIPKAPIECEVFVHGALCTSLSGQCLMSSFFGGRSANRGDCAQPCRLPFSRPEDIGESHALSLKDLCLLDALPELVQMGTSSFKIEGRMKRPEYVAAAVTACRQALEGECSTLLRKNLKDVFSRSGFTSGYYDAQRGRNMEGFRRKEDVISAKDALPALSALYSKEKPRFAVDFSLSAEVGKFPSLSVKFSDSDIAELTVYGKSLVEKADSQQSLLSERIHKQLCKCGGTQFYCVDCDIKLEHGSYLALSAVNALRREALALLDAKLADTDEFSYRDLPITKYDTHASSAQSLHIRVADARALPSDLRGVSRIILPLDAQIPPALPPEATPAVEIPRGIFGDEDAVLEKLLAAKSKGFRLAIVAGVDGAALAARAGLDFAAGFGSNICNTATVLTWKKLGAKDALISPELNLSQASKLGGELARSIIAYGKLPLMLLRRCPQKGSTDCNGTPYITDRMNKKFSLKCHDSCYSEVIACDPVYLGDRQAELSFADNLLLYFTDEPPEECAKILTAFRKALRPEGKYTRGLPGFTAVKQISEAP